jgi:hypothetical protein
LSKVPCSLQYQCSFQSFQRIGCLQYGHLSFSGSFAFVTIVCPSISNLYSCFCIIFISLITRVPAGVLPVGFEPTGQT